MVENILGILGISRRAGKIIFGQDAVSKGIYCGSVRLVILSSDVSKRTRRVIEELCKRYEIAIAEPGCTMEQLGNAIGRSETAVAALTDDKLSIKVKEMCHAN